MRGLHLEDRPRTDAPTTPLPSLPAHPRRLFLPRGGELEVVHVVPEGSRPPATQAEGARLRAAWAFAPVVAQRYGALFLVVEGAPPAVAEVFHRRVRQAVAVERGVTPSRLLRAVSAGCQAVEAQAFHRYELAAFGVTALLVESTLHRYASVSQLPPCQAYVWDRGELKGRPQEQMWRAEHVASPEGRRWPVELDLERMTIHPGATILLCSATLGARLPAAAVKAVLQLPLDLAGQALREAWCETLPRVDVGEMGEALLIRVPESAPQQRVRLFASPAERHRHPPPARRYGRGGTESGADDLGPEPPLRQWGLEGQRRRQVPLIGAWLARLLDVERVMTPSRPRRHRRRGLLLGGAAAVAAAGGALQVWRRPTQPAPRVAAPPPSPTATPPPLAGRSLLLATDPLLAFSVIGRGDLVYVLDAGQQLRRLGDAPGPATRPDGVLRLSARASLMTRRGDTLLWLDADRRLWAWRGGDAAVQALRNAPGWRHPVAIATYGGNLYVLDAGDERTAGQIWRYPGGDGDQYTAEPQPWLRPDGGVSLRGATGLAIDGAIWVTRDDGAILHLSGGRPAPFQITGLETPITVAGAIYTEPEYRSIYVVDAAARRLVQLSKSGQFERQAHNVFPAGEQVRGVWVAEAGGRALILTDRRVQEVVVR